MVWGGGGRGEGGGGRKGEEGGGRGEEEELTEHIRDFSNWGGGGYILSSYCGGSLQKRSPGVFDETWKMSQQQTKLRHVKFNISDLIALKKSFVTIKLDLLR